MLISSLSSRSGETLQGKIGRPLRVLYIDQNSILGGGQLALVRLMQELDRSKVEPVVVLGRSGFIEEPLRSLAATHVLPLNERVSNLKWETYGLLLPLFACAAVLSMIRYIRDLARLIKRERIDVIHANSMKACIFGGIAARLTATPFIWHQRARISTDSLPASAVAVDRLLLRIVPNFVIANSYATLSTLKLPVSKPRSVVYSTIDAEALREAAKDKMPFRDVVGAGIEIKIGVVGRIIPWKGQDIFIKAAAIVHKRYPKTRFYVIGSAADDAESKVFEGEILALAQALNLGPDVLVFTGFQREVHQAIANLHIVVNPSTKPEPIAQVAAQALMAGKVVIASEGGGTPEIISDRKTGLLVEPGSPQALAEAIIEVLFDPDAAQIMAEEGTKKVNELFCPTTIARQLEQIYFTLAPSPI